MWEMWESWDPRLTKPPRTKDARGERLAEPPRKGNYMMWEVLDVRLTEPPRTKNVYSRAERRTSNRKKRKTTREKARRACWTSKNEKTEQEMWDPPNTRLAEPPQRGKLNNVCENQRREARRTSIRKPSKKCEIYKRESLNLGERGNQTKLWEIYETWNTNTLTVRLGEPTPICVWVR